MRICIFYVFLFGTLLAAFGTFLRAASPVIGMYVHWFGIAVGFLSPLMGVADAVYPAMFGKLSEFDGSTHPSKRIGVGLVGFGYVLVGANIFVRWLVMRNEAVANVLLWSGVALVVVGSGVLFFSLFKEHGHWGKQ